MPLFFVDEKSVVNDSKHMMLLHRTSNKCAIVKHLRTLPSSIVARGITMCKIECFLACCKDIGLIKFN